MVVGPDGSTGSLSNRIVLELDETFMPPVPADADGDGDVDADDFGEFQLCLTGPSMGPPSAGCGMFDFDADNDVDQADFGGFQRCLSGPDTPAEPACAD